MNSQTSYVETIVKKATLEAEQRIYSALVAAAESQNNQTALELLQECGEYGKALRKKHIETYAWACEVIDKLQISQRYLIEEFDVIFEKAVIDDNKVAMQVLEKCKEHYEFDSDDCVMSALACLDWSPEVEATCEWIVNELKETVEGDETNQTFFNATRLGNLEMIKWAIKKGGDVNKFEDGSDESTSIWCAFCGKLDSERNLEIMDVLMAAGLDLSQSGEFALHKCDGFPEMAKRMLVAGASPEPCMGKMPMYTTVESTRKKIKN